MHFLILGGSGQTGSHVIANILQQEANGHTVTALVRNTSSITSRAGLTLVQGTPSNIDDIRKAFATPRAPDAVIITLAHVKGAVFDERGTTFLTHVARNIAQALRESTTTAERTKVVYMSAMGSGESFANLNFLMRGLVKVTPLKNQFNDHKGAENTLLALAREGGNDGKKVVTTIVRPVMLTNTGAAEVESLGENGENGSFMPKVSRASVARFMVDAALGTEWDDKLTVIANVST
jgi:nucleoside-diphosphate-sugar epimerase